VKFYESNSNKVVAETLSETDGYIYYLGLDPGEYVARIDPEQLAKLNMVSTPELIPVHISNSLDGDIVGGLDFTLSPKKEIESDIIMNGATTDSANIKKAQRDTFKIIPSHQPTPEKISVIAYTGKVLQIGAYRIKSNALIAQKKAMNLTDKPVILIYERGLDKVCITGLSNQKDVSQLITQLSKNGYPKAYIRNPAREQSQVKKIDNEPYSAVIQVATFKIKDNAVRAKQNIIKSFDHKVTIIFKYGFYNLQIWEFTNRNEAFEFLPKLIDLGFTDAYIIRVKQN
jgi:osmotically-inducible protein OsmY